LKRRTSSDPPPFPELTGDHRSLLRRDLGRDGHNGDRVTVRHVAEDAQVGHVPQQATRHPAPGHSRFWTAPKVAKWIDEKAGYKVDDHTGWLYLRRLGYTRQSPRPTHPESDEKAQEAFKKGGFKKPLMGSFENIPTPTSRSGRKTKLASG
jgi:hypothetical protein